MLCGICGSCAFQSLLEPRRAALRSSGASSVHAPPRTTCGYVLVTGTTGLSTALSRQLLVAVGDVLVEAPFGHVAVHVVEAPGIRLLLADLVILLVAVVVEPGVVAELRRDRRRTSRPWSCRPGRHIPIRPRSAGGSSGRSWPRATCSTSWRQTGSCRRPDSPPCPCRRSCRNRAWWEWPGRRPSCPSRSASCSSAFRRCWSRPNPHSSYSSQVTSHLPIQNGSSLTSTCGPSSALRPFSPAGLPILNVPPGIGTMSNFTSVLQNLLGVRLHARLVLGLGSRVLAPAWAAT